MGTSGDMCRGVVAFDLVLLFSCCYIRMYFIMFCLTRRLLKK